MYPHSIYLGLKLKYLPRGSICTTIFEFSPQNHDKDGLLRPNSIIVVVCTDPLGYIGTPLKAYVYTLRVHGALAFAWVKLGALVVTRLYIR